MPGHNVFRGQVLSFGRSEPHGNELVSFPAPQVLCPAGFWRPSNSASPGPPDLGVQSAAISPQAAGDRGHILLNTFRAVAA